MSDHAEGAGFQPHVPAAESPPELTLRAVLLGAVLGIVYGAASTYLALRVGLTVSASVPIAVLAIAILRKTATRRTILEHNVVQTAGSAGESVAAALAFTVPALIFLGFPLRPGLTTLIALTGGCLGVLMMVPLRRYLIVKEHGKLRYPEGKACAEILIAGERGGTSARKVFIGIAFGAAFKALQAILGAVKITASFSFAQVTALKGAFFKGLSFACDFEPPLLGVGYILGYRTSMIMVAGSLLASLVLVPLIVYFGQDLTVALAGADKLIKEMSAGEVRGKYVKTIGAGAVAMGGIFGLVRAMPAIASSLVASARGIAGGGGAKGVLRTERDTPLPVLALGAAAIVAFIVVLPTFRMSLTGALLIVVFGFLFAVVSSRITGEVGSSSCPLSGMTIGVLMGVCGLFVATDKTDDTYVRLALIIGAIVCIAISNAGTCSQDLKTGFLVGATPVKQQTALLIGVLACVPAVGWTTYLLNETEAREVPLVQRFVVKPEWRSPAVESIVSKQDGKSYLFVKLDEKRATGTVQGTDEKTSQAVVRPSGAGNYLVDPATGEAVYKRSDGIGGEKFPAPQSGLMANIISGVMQGNLPWDLILLGAAIALFVELLGFGSLTFAVGVYLPLSSTLPVYLGGIVRKIADRRYARKPDAEDEPEGTLWCSGLIAGASILAILATAQGFFEGYDADNGYHPAVALLRDLPAWMDAHMFLGASDAVSFLLLCALGACVLKGAAPRRAAV